MSNTQTLNKGTEMKTYQTAIKEAYQIAKENGLTGIEKQQFVTEYTKKETQEIEKFYEEKVVDIQDCEDFHPELCLGQSQVALFG